ncbi:hypothetical protein, partial [Desulfolutivibrio sp.]|uniref:hypothetical protein n=1 Tax=Desulfolutivibrio sp. TaxID=2773296 RepID=UPI002FC1C8CC
MPDNPDRRPCHDVPGDGAPNDPEDMEDMDAPDMPTAPVSLTIPAAAAGRRLDRVLGLVFPGLGLRRLRRVFAQYEVTVDGVARQAAF